MLQRLLCAGLVAVSCSLPALSRCYAASSEAVLHSFQGGSEGGDLYSSLIQVNGLLYGTTTIGGVGCESAGGCGSIFSVDPTTRATKTLYMFQGGADGAEPQTGLLRVGSKLYGTTALGGSSVCHFNGVIPGCGTVFSYDLATGREAVVHVFTGGKTDGFNVQSPLLRVGNTLYGATLGGGRKKYGTVFSIDLATKTERILHGFGAPDDGANPQGPLVLFDGLLFGTTLSTHRIKGEPREMGTLFSVDPASGDEKVVCTFQVSAGGWYPIGGVIALGNKLYGTTYWGGDAEPYGTVYSVDPATGVETVVHAFTSLSAGHSPDAGVIAVNGKLYGTTSLGGADNGGTIFSLDPGTGKYTSIYDFPGGAGGFNPQAALLHAGGHFYGTTLGRGTNKCTSDCGTVFTFTP